MNTIFLVEELILKSIEQLKKGNCTRLETLHRGYFSSLDEAKKAICTHAEYSNLRRLGFYIKEYKINPKPEICNSQIRQYTFAVDGESITTYQFYDCYHAHFEGTDAPWKIGDMVLFEHVGHIWMGRIVKVPHTKQWFIEHAEYVEQYYNRLNAGEVNEDDDMELEDVYYVSTLEEMSVAVVKSANIFQPTFPISPAVLLRFPSPTQFQ